MEGLETLATVDTAVWQRITQHVIAHGGNLIRPWFVDLDPIAMEHGLLEIQAPGLTEKDYLQKHATGLFIDAAQTATGHLVSVCFLAEADRAARPAPSQAASPVAVSAEGDDEAPLNDDYTFANFVAGPCNRLAHAACQAVCESPGISYNPLFIHGDVGLGKTHLLHAVCHELKRRRPEGRYCMLSCETFVNHFIQAVETGQLSQFRYRYRHVDVLIIDDVQFLSDREQTQEEFHHTFNVLYQARKQIILSCDRGPAQIPHLEQRLVSRFSWGMVAPVDPPGYETRVAIVRKKSRVRGFELPDDVVRFVAGSIDSNPRVLEGAMTRVVMQARAQDRPIDLSVAEEALGSVEPQVRREITIDQIMDVVTGRFNVRVADLQSKKRTRSIAFPRQLCMYLARQLTRHSLEEVGGYFGGRDHTTVLHANRTIEALRKRDAEVNALLIQLFKQLKRPSL